MTATGTGTAVMLVVAAVLWFLYLLPMWVRKRQYVTERTAERVELALQAIEAREELRARREAEAAYAAARERAAVEAAAQARHPGVDRQARLRARIRRGRMFASTLMLVATGVGLVQMWLMSATGPSVGGWLVLGGSLAAGLVAVGAQRRLDRRAAAHRAVPPARARVRVARSAPAPDASAPAPIAWTPVPLPPPLASGPRQRIRPPIDAERLKREAEAAAAAAARPAPQVVPFPDRAARPPVPAERPVAAGGRFAAMGIVDPGAVGMPDIDEALRKRRSFAG